MRRGNTNILDNATRALPLPPIIRSLAIAGIGFGLSGCVATALTPTASIPSPALTANLQATDSSLDSGAVDGGANSDGVQADADTPDNATDLPTGMTVPVKRPVREGENRLALAATGGETIAAQKANSIAAPIVHENAAAATGDQETTPVLTPAPVTSVQTEQKKPKKGFFASLFQPAKKPQKPTRLALAKPVNENSARVKEKTAPPQATKQSIPEPKSVSKPEPDSTAPPAPVAQPKPKKAKKGFFASLFQSNNNSATNHAAPSDDRPDDQRKQKRKAAIFKQNNNSALPGVRKLGLFGIYEATEGADEGYSPIQVASVGGLARTSPNGLRIQTARVQVACLQPGLIKIFNKVQRRYGRVPIITSGYRSPAANRRARGARNSMHIYCKAADIQVTGVSKWALAKYLRTIPGRGGVGTYCYTKSVHIDIGTKRDWNWRCRRGKRKRR